MSSKPQIQLLKKTHRHPTCCSTVYLGYLVEEDKAQLVVKQVISNFDIFTTFYHAANPSAPSDYIPLTISGLVRYYQRYSSPMMLSEPKELYLDNKINTVEQYTSYFDIWHFFNERRDDIHSNHIDDILGARIEHRYSFLHADELQVVYPDWEMVSDNSLLLEGAEKFVIAEHHKAQMLSPGEFSGYEMAVAGWVNAFHEFDMER
jgi:hypothetical protein